MSNTARAHRPDCVLERCQTQADDDTMVECGYTGDGILLQDVTRVSDIRSATQQTWLVRHYHGSRLRQCHYKRAPKKQGQPRSQTSYTL